MSSARSSLGPLVGLLLALTLGADPARAAVRVVGPAPGDHPTIQAAVDAAAPGDIVLVRAGNYPAFTIDGKGLSVVADTGTTVSIVGQVLVRNLPAGSQLAIVRLEVVGVDAVGVIAGAAMRLENCAGHIRIDGCKLRGGDGGPLQGCSVVGDPDAAPGLDVVRCGDAAVVLSSLRGGDAHNLFVDVQCDGNPVVGGHGGHGLRVADSRVAIYDTALLGGEGGSAWYNGGHGGDALHAEDTVPTAGPTEVFASNTMFDGSTHGGDAFDYIGGEVAGSGGNAIDARDTSVVRVLDSTYLSGIGGCTLAGCLPQAPLLQIAPLASVTELTGSSKGFGMPRVLREGQSTQMSFVGASGDGVYLLLAATQEQVYVAALKGSFLLGAGLFGPVGLGTVAGSGTLTFPVNIPNLPVGTDGVSIELQALLLSTAGSATLTGAVHLTLLDASL